MNKTVSFLQQAACFIELEAEDLENRPNQDHRGRQPEQMKDIAKTNRRLAKALRDHAAEIEVVHA